MERVAAWAQLVSLVIVGVVAGMFVATQVGQLRVQDTLDARDFVLVKHGFEVAGLWIGVIVVTLVLNAPVNAEAVNWDPAAPPVDWEAQRDRWHLGQSVRTPMAVASFVCLGLASQWDRLWS